MATKNCFKSAIRFLIILLPIASWAQTTVTVSGKTNGDFGSPIDTIVPFVHGVTVTGPSIITITATGCVTDVGVTGCITPNGVSFNATTTPLQEAGINGNPDPNLDGLIGAFVPANIANDPNFQPIDSTKADCSPGPCINPNLLFLVGASDTIRVNGPGSLYLGIDDFIVNDNGGSHTVTITVTPLGDVFQVNYAANLSHGDSVINITNTGTSDGDNLCVNVYAFDPSEELIACCSCLVTPNALVSLSAQADLISNTLSPSTPDAIVIKLLATDAGAGSCDPARVSFGNLAPGIRAWGTMLHALPGTPVTYGLTEKDFLNGGLSQAELTHLTSFCGFAEANGSGFGICKSCRAGGLGGAKQ